MNDKQAVTRLLMNRDRFSDMKTDSPGQRPAALEGEVILALDRFALTVNNITYAAFGDALHYWDFFPTGVEGWGLLPVWGYADVVDSGVDGIDVGQRYFGYYPTATHLSVRPGKSGSKSFRDEAPHRRELPAVYNWYQRTDDNRFHNDATEPLNAIFRPLFVTAYGLADFLVQNDFFGAERVVLSSASSRTGYAVAFCIDQLKAIETIGLTSAEHREFVDGLGLYAGALAYDDLEDLEADKSTVYVDVAGNADVQMRIHRHLGDKLVHDAALGAAHRHDPPQAPDDLPGPEPKFFFAPDWVAQRQADWGTAGFEQRIGQATAGFFDYVRGNQLIDVRQQQGLDAARDIIGEMLDGKTDPAVGHVVRLRGS